jgi:hypothetical protein
MGLSVNAEIAASVASFRFNEVELRRLQAIPVMADLSRRAIRVESAAKRNASGRPGPNVRMRGSITWRPGVDARSAYVDIGTAVVYAPFVELGTSRSPAYPFLRPALEAARTI